ncbi:mitochondrial import inner membrane translocase subunit TIM22 [Dacryopinax primogenitus]|uniref:Mitochondrial import inner membrane translocase subunit TIM22 n=1 Tax=Dacryopinax primogenitus (strain DJM 731) TaxID=1858805 RepID=M5FN61_DACPD|nr:mitochondrial import inner membrane translocase subunit TIM22 [Dacryopinax primogenitus]EJT96885.1 mitochondrial import inner membrane translocase subunit TIM22 [Dacryopinax primogenitus]
MDTNQASPIYAQGITHPLLPPLGGPNPVLPPELTPEEKTAVLTQLRWTRYSQIGMESCAFKTLASGTIGFGLGAFISLMSASLQYEDPILRQQSAAGQALSSGQKTLEVFKEMGRGMWRSGKGFGKVGALYAGSECVIESYRARNDMTNAVAAGFVSGAILAASSGPKAAFGGGLAFAAFSAAIDMFMRRETKE